MTTAATVTAQLILDASKFSSGMKDATKSAETFESKMKSVAATMTKVGTAMTAAITVPLAMIGKQAIDMASNYAESLNKVNVVFENSSDVIEKWAKDAAKNLGLSQQAALEAAATYGNLFTAQGMGVDQAAEMSVALVNLSADLASFNNANPEDVLLALRSGLSGEIEPLKKFGIALSESLMKLKAVEMGLGDNVQALTEAQKIAIRYAIIMDQTTKAQGDFARTSQGLANQLRTMKAQWGDTLKILGDNLLPLVIKIIQQLNKWLEWFNNAPPATQKFIATLLLIAFVAGPLLIVFGKLLPLAFNGATKSMNPFSGGIFGLIGTFVKWIGVAALVVKVLTALGIATGPVGAGILAVNVAIAGVGTSLALVILPIIVIIGTLALLYYAFKNNVFGITDTVKQLWFLIKYYFGNIADAFYKLIEGLRTGAYQFEALFEDGSGALHDLAVAFGFPEQAAQDFLGRMFFVASGFIQLFRGDMLQAVKDFAAGLFGITNPQLEALINRFKAFAMRVGDTFRNVSVAAKQLWTIIKFVFSGIVNMIAVVISAIGRLVAAFLKVKLPPALTPGSPTPFEMGLRGISSAMDDLSRKSLPKLNAGMNVSQNASGGNGGINNYTDNRRFSAGMDANALRVALDAKFKRISDNL